nr:MAG: hypothetical protein [Metapenaeus ensis nimavirus]
MGSAARQQRTMLVPGASLYSYNDARELLKQRYGDVFTIAQAYRKKLDEWPKVSINNGSALMKFSDYLQNCKTAMNSIPYLSTLNDPSENQKMLYKLPNPIVERWNKLVNKEMSLNVKVEGENISQGLLYKGDFPSFKRFCGFIRKEALDACNPITSVTAVKSKAGYGGYPENVQRKGNKTQVVKSFATETNETVPEKKRGYACPFCSQQHNLNYCDGYLKLDLEGRKNFVFKHKLCRGCLMKGHIFKNCRQKVKCKTCNRLHPTSLHDDTRMQRENKEESETKDEVNQREKEAAVSHTIKVNKSVGSDNSMA